MSLLSGRAKEPQPVDGDSTAGMLIALTARVDQAGALITDALRVHKGNAHLVDVLLDIRNALTPPRRT